MLARRAASTIVVATIGALGIVVFVACSSSSSTSDPGDAAADRAPDEPYVPDPNNCVKPGYKGNDFGVGAYCEPGQGCPMSTQKGVFLICTGGNGAASDEVFCTAPCTEDSECGEQAWCHHDPRGSGCVPAVCGGRPDDAGADVAADSAGDAPADAPEDG
jgi:hypothetical protein